jgi:hypothetical protein
LQFKCEIYSALAIDSIHIISISHANCMYVTEFLPC